MLICLFFSLGMLSIIIPGYGDSHCDGNPQGCAICSTTPPNYVVKEEVSTGYCQCCKDLDGDGIYHYVQCDWTDYSCLLYVFDLSSPTLYFETSFPCSTTINCNVMTPISECYPIGY